MQTTGGFHDQAIEPRSHIAGNSVLDAENFDTAITVFYPDAHFRDLFILFFLFYGQLLPFWSIGRLVNGGVFRLISLKTRILPKFTPFWKGYFLLTGQFLSYFLPAASPLAPSFLFPFGVPPVQIFFLCLVLEF